MSKFYHNTDGCLPELYTAAQVRAMDRYAIDKLGVPGLELMHRAGESAFHVIRERWPKVRRIVIVCGAGNNAGEGYVVARFSGYWMIFVVKVWLIGWWVKCKSNRHQFT